ncbi:MAG: hypothetical protein IH944_03440 [Armatimonadetes bacterium]|nr:hypothetical protein [Armatimonadota bacterium]
MRSIIDGKKVAVIAAISIIFLGTLVSVVLMNGTEEDDLAVKTSADRPVDITDELTTTLIEQELRSAWFDPTRDDLTEPGKPAEWDGIVAKMREAINGREWSLAANYVAALEDMLPNPMPDEYPWNLDTKESFQSARAELLFFAGQTDYSEEICKSVSKRLESEESYWGGSYAVEDAEMLLARISARRGDYSEALELLDKSANASWSGCGNCEEGEEIWNSPIKQVWQAALLPKADAVRALQSIRLGDILLTESSLNGDTTDWQRDHAWAEASFALAEIAIREGDEARARHFLEQAASSNIESCEARKLAIVWLPLYATSAEVSLTPQ